MGRLRTLYCELLKCLATLLRGLEATSPQLLPVLRSPIFKRQRHPRHHQNIRPPKALRSLLLQLRSFQLTMSRCFKQPNAAAMNSCDQISQRAKGHNAVEFYEEGMTPLLSYMFFVLHYHENL